APQQHDEAAPAGHRAGVDCQRDRPDDVVDVAQYQRVVAIPPAVGQLDFQRRLDALAKEWFDGDDQQFFGRFGRRFRPGGLVVLQFEFDGRDQAVAVGQRGYAINLDEGDVLAGKTRL